MKTNNLQRMLAGVAIAGLALTASAAMAQNSPAPSMATSASAPQLSYGVSEVVKLVEAKASDDTIIAYVKNSGTSYGLNADQIIYLQQQGASSAVITTMLNQPRAGMAASAPATYVPQPTTPAPQPDYSGGGSPPAPNVTYVQSVPTTSYYYNSYPYYYPSYGYYGYYGYPAVSFGWGWGGFWLGGWGCGFHGGWGGGFHGGGFHGGGHH